ncbi:hypothetical protein [Streptomyces sp. NPDC093795]|uniref:hypothetical protein n=1 Tax=Streptomyces sp. NPDC093795 TaxID=3366051 RepID=UPI003806C5CE
MTPLDVLEGEDDPAVFVEFGEQSGARAGGTTITDLIEELASKELTGAEREQRAAEAARELGVEYTEQVQQTGQDAWAKIRAHQGRAA